MVQKALNLKKNKGNEHQGKEKIIYFSITEYIWGKYYPDLFRLQFRKNDSHAILEEIENHSQDFKLKKKVFISPRANKMVLNNFSEYYKE